MVLGKVTVMQAAKAAAEVQANVQKKNIDDAIKMLEEKKRVREEYEANQKKVEAEEKAKLKKELKEQADRMAHREILIAQVKKEEMERISQRRALRAALHVQVRERRAKAQEGKSDAWAAEQDRLREEKVAIAKAKAEKEVERVRREHFLEQQSALLRAAEQKAAFEKRKEEEWEAYCERMAEAEKKKEIYEMRVREKLEKQKAAAAAQLARVQANQKKIDEVVVQKAMEVVVKHETYQSRLNKIAADQENEKIAKVEINKIYQAKARRQVERMQRSESFQAKMYQQRIVEKLVRVRKLEQARKEVCESPTPHSPINP